MTHAVDIVGLSKTFPGQRALDNVSLDVRSGEVHGLLGENGSGKSTLIKVLSGYHEPDPGASISINGRPLTFGSAASSSALGLRFVHQNLGIIPQMTAVENLALSTETRSGALTPLNKATEVRRTRTLFDRFGVDIPMHVPLGQCRAVDRTVVAIVRALDTLREGGVLVLDEPTAALPPDEVSHLFDVVRDLTHRSISTIYVSHRLDEVFRLVDRVSILRDGVMQGTHDVTALDHRELVRLIVGSVHARYQRGDDVVTVGPGDSHERSAVPRSGEPRLVVNGLRSDTIVDVTFQVWPGEIVGVAGITGSGRESFAASLVGASKASVGSVTLDGRLSDRPMTPRRARRLGVALVPGNRGAGSAIGAFDVRENISLPSLSTVARSVQLDRHREVATAAQWITQLDIRPTDPLRAFRNLSGGNQQKVILAKWFNTDPRVVLLDDPTSGVDVGARQAIYDLIRDRARGGTSFIVSSSDHEDLLSLCDRVLVMRDGVIAEVLDGADVTAHNLLLAQAGPSNLPDPPSPDTERNVAPADV